MKTEPQVTVTSYSYETVKVSCSLDTFPEISKMFSLAGWTLAPLSGSGMTGMSDITLIFGRWKTKTRQAE